MIAAIRLAWASFWQGFREAFEARAYAAKIRHRMREARRRDLGRVFVQGDFPNPDPALVGTPVPHGGDPALDPAVAERRAQRDLRKAMRRYGFKVEDLAPKVARRLAPGVAVDEHLGGDVPAAMPGEKAN